MQLNNNNNKAIAAVAVFLSFCTYTTLALASSSAAASSHDELKDEIALPPPSFKHNHDIDLQRMLQMQNAYDQCTNSNDYLSYKDELEIWCLELEPQAFTQQGDTFTFKYGVCEPTFSNQLEKVCNASGGKF